MNNRSIEIMAPVGSFEALMAAINTGAQSVYFGVGSLNMRSRSSANFTIEDLFTIANICREHQVKSYLTVNTVVYNNELDALRELLTAAKEADVSAIIASDFATISEASQMGLRIHASTQCNITNIAAVRFYAQFADVMVLARETSVKQMREICQQIVAENICGPSGKPIVIEVFVHGALCMAVSGKCYISLDNFNYSANRGACLQPCRRGYHVQDVDNEVELAVENKYIMSPKDLCTLPFLDKLLNAGVSILKIEGRGRSPEYVKMVVACYREAIEAIENGTYTQEKIAEWMDRLRSVYNRDFWDGYYLGRTVGEWTERYGSQATRVKQFVGKVTNYFSKLGVVEIHIETGELTLGDEIMFLGPTTGVVDHKVEEIRVDLKPVSQAEKGALCSLATAELVRRNDKVYKWVTVIEED